ncbi:MAG TPA: FmdB family zinc ribbon protein [Acidimicrobiales bacterium]
MPTYEYACTACGHRLEAVQKFTDDPLTECPECHSALRKVYGAVGIVLKGSGFYKTDSRAAASAGNGKSAKGSGSDKASEKESSSSSDSSSKKDSSDSSSKSDSSGDSGSKDAKPKPAAAAAT